MRISAQDLDRYRKALRALARQAAERVEAEIAALGYTTVAEAREAAIAAIGDTIGAEGYAAQALAAKLFDEVCAAEGIDANPGELFEDLIDYDMLEDKVHWYARRLIEDDRSGFAASCSGLASFYTKRCAYENMQRNCHANDVRYARVPSGAETCPWCMMLASRGFVYHTRATASHGMHQNCDCIIVPGRGGDGARDATQIDGYDPNEWYQRWAGTGFAGAGSGSRVGEAAHRHEPTMSAEDSMALQRKLLKGLSKADRDQAMDIIIDANDAWANERHDVEVHNHFAERIQRAMMDNHITSKDLAKRAKEKIGTGGTLESVGAMRYRTNRSSNVILNQKRFGHKLSKHCRDWGLDPSSADDRQRFYEIASDIIDTADEIVIGTTWRDQPQPCTFYRKGDDLVLVNGYDEFVTMMRGGASNRRFLSAREEARNA